MTARGSIMKTGKRHTLLLFRNKYRSHRALYLIVFLLCMGLYTFLYLVPDNLVALDVVNKILPYAWIALVAGSIAFIVFLFRMIASQIPYIQCFDNNFKIQTPLYPIVFSYRRVKETRPNALFEIFKKDKVSGREARFLEQYSGQMALIVELDGFPMPLNWLKFWMTNLMFTPDGRGIVVWVQDWMTLNREFGDFKDKWRDRRTGKDQETKLSPYARFIREQ
jgi:hypothetical protein